MFYTRAVKKTPKKNEENLRNSKCNKSKRRRNKFIYRTLSLASNVSQFLLFIFFFFNFDMPSTIFVFIYLLFWYVLPVLCIPCIWEILLNKNFFVKRWQMIIHLILYRKFKRMGFDAWMENGRLVKTWKRCGITFSFRNWKIYIDSSEEGLIHWWRRGVGIFEVRLKFRYWFILSFFGINYTRLKFVCSMLIGWG